MGILPFKCGINGCKKSKLQKHTHFSGELRNYADRGLIARYEEYARMTGQPMTVPGGLEAGDLNMYMRKRLKDGDKEAKEFRKRVSQELADMKKRGEKQDSRRAEANVRDRKKR